ncbi:hypothetical protein CBM2587_B90199 [Cupriavidus taiwanensis]|uniref:Uncharacterized protein n=1 Tax=Cupriavidus taiwanensis TaxID=164546 RepID=A0A975XEA4_9BURK|nr:hypothetical protein CBM2587_B90199 [Cupriavidus taiwanensis]
MTVVFDAFTERHDRLRPPFLPE